ADLQPAFRRLLDGAAFYTLQRNRYFRKGDALVTDLGPLAAFFTYASGVEAETLGKPSPLLFDAIAAECGVVREEILMAGGGGGGGGAGRARLRRGGDLVRRR